MLNQEALKFVNNTLLTQAAALQYIVKSEAPGTEKALFNSPSLVIWNGASDKTVFQDPSVNYAFRALHDKLHLETGLDFSVESEIELGRIQASKYNSDLMAELIYAEVVLQAEYYKETGTFVKNQVDFTMSHLNKFFKFN